MFSLGGDVHGVQQSFGFTAAERVDGAQLGLINTSAEGVRGAQIGGVNIAGGPVHGAQIGAINIGESADVGIGLINIYTRGRTHWELTGDSSGFFRMAIKHGSGPWHSVYSVGVNPFYGETALLLGLGFGGRIPLADFAFLDLDAVSHWIVDTRWQIGPTFVTGGRALVGLRPVEDFAIVFGLGFDVHNTADTSTPIYAQVLGTTLADNTRIWPTLDPGDPGLLTKAPALSDRAGAERPHILPSCLAPPRRRVAGRPPLRRR